MKVAIVEDEQLAAERIEILLKQYDPGIEILARLDSVKATVQYLKTKTAPDVLLMDIHLSDGHSFEVFQQVNYTRPVIFTTAFDEYALEAFKLFSVDYILKPVTLETLATALNKLKSFTVSIQGIDYNHLLPEWSGQIPAYKKRFLGKIGQRLFFVCTNTIALFEAHNKIVHVYDREGHSYLVDRTMEKLEEQLDPKEFFRINRSIIVHIDAIEHIKSYFNKRLRLQLKGVAQEKEIIISRERVAEFKQWAGV